MLTGDDKVLKWCVQMVCGSVVLIGDVTPGAVDGLHHRSSSRQSLVFLVFVKHHFPKVAYRYEDGKRQKRKIRRLCLCLWFSLSRSSGIRDRDSGAVWKIT